MNKLMVIEKKGQALTTSRKVAEIFEKDHDNVLRDIRTLIEGLKKTSCSKISSLNFEESTYKSRGKKYPEYLMNRDAFSLLAMGFTGQKALKWKIQYINAFNQMEEFILSIQTAKLEYPAFTSAITQAHEEPKSYHYSNEINMINKIVLGMDAKRFKKLKGLDKNIKSIRPYLTLEQIKAIEELQRVDIGLIIAISESEKRKQILAEYFKNRLLKLIA